MDEPHGLPSVFAAVHTMNQYDEATMEFSVEGVDESTEYEIDEKIVHELMHMAARDQWRSVMSLEPAFGTPAWEMFHDRYEHETEGLVDRVARALVAAHHRPWEDVVLFSTTQTEE